MTPAPARPAVSHQAISSPGDSFARFQEKLQSLYQKIPNLQPLMMNPPSE